MNASTQQQVIQSTDENVKAKAAAGKDDFLTEKELVSFGYEAAERTLRRALSELDTFFRETKWEDAISLFHPVCEKLPELSEHGLDIRVRERLAFALGQIKRFDDAIVELSACLKKEPSNFQLHSSFGYTAYNSLYAAKNRELVMTGKIRAERIELAHEHFKEAQRLRPDGISNYYREGMLLKQIEGKPEKSIPFFDQAVTNWDRLSDSDKELRHQEKKNFVKSLYQLASALLDRGSAARSLTLIKRCLAEDEKSGHLSLVFKYYALGKIYYHLNQFGEARNALLFSLQAKGEQPVDFVYELLARAYLATGNPAKAMETIRKVPENRRRPYYRWTEADVFCSLKDYATAKKVLVQALERDNRSRHKTLIRIARIEYFLENFQAVRNHAAESGRFYREKWGNTYQDGLFWEAIGAFRAGDREAAETLATDLKDINPYYPKLDRLLSCLKEPPR